MALGKMIPQDIVDKKTKGIKKTNLVPKRVCVNINKKPAIANESKLILTNFSGVNLATVLLLMKEPKQIPNAASNITNPFSTGDNFN